MRKYEAAYLAANGDERSITRLAPATGLFEAAFMGFSRGTLIATPDGTVAIEDIYPGMSVMTDEDGAQRVLWKGATTIVPDAPGQSSQAARLVRMPAETMGLQRPTHDLLLGRGARVWRESRGLMVSGATLIDEDVAFAVMPQSPVRVFHLALAQHCCIRANGIEVESFHPGEALSRVTRPELRGLYVSLFPHLTSLAGFGPMRFLREAEAFEPLPELD